MDAFTQAWRPVVRGSKKAPLLSNLELWTLLGASDSANTLLRELEIADSDKVTLNEFLFRLTRRLKLEPGSEEAADIKQKAQKVRIQKDEAVTAHTQIKAAMDANKVIDIGIVQQQLLNFLILLREGIRALPYYVALEVAETEEAQSKLIVALRNELARVLSIFGETRVTELFSCLQEETLQLPSNPAEAQKVILGQVEIEPFTPKIEQQEEEDDEVDDVQ